MSQRGRSSSEDSLPEFSETVLPSIEPCDEGYGPPDVRKPVSQELRYSHSASSTPRNPLPSGHQGSGQNYSDAESDIVVKREQSSSPSGPYDTETTAPKTVAPSEDPDLTEEEDAILGVCSDPDIPFEKYMIQQPAREARIGVTLTPPIVVDLVGREHLATKGSSKSAATYWAQATVVTGQYRQPLAPPSITLLSGTLAAGINEDIQCGKKFATVCFEDLKIHEAGSFRIRILFFEKRSTEHDRNLDSDFPSTQVRNMGRADTKTIHVSSGSPTSESNQQT